MLILAVLVLLAVVAYSVVMIRLRLAEARRAADEADRDRE